MTVVRADEVEAALVVGEEVLRYLGLDPNNAETRALVMLCERYQLDPLLGHASIIATKNGYRPYITRDGMLEVAHRSGRLDGIVVDEERRNSTNDGWTAYVSVFRNDMAHPFRYGAQCKDAEAQAKAGNGPEMALARAERRALRRAFRIPAPELVNDDDLEVVDVTPADADRGAAHPPDGAPKRRRRATASASTPRAEVEAAPADAEADPAGELEGGSTREQRDEMLELMRARGYTEQRDRLVLASGIVGRRLEAASELTAAEADVILAKLRALAAAPR